MILNIITLHDNDPATLIYISIKPPAMKHKNAHRHPLKLSNLLNVAIGYS